MATIALEGMSFFAYHGLYPEEKVSGNQFSVDVSVETNQTPNTNDQIDGTVDYVVLYQCVSQVMESRVDLLETLVSGIGTQIMARFPDLISVKVRVSKLNPPLGGACVRAFVEQTFYSGK